MGKVISFALLCHQLARAFRGGGQNSIAFFLHRFQSLVVLVGRKLIPVGDKRFHICKRDLIARETLISPALLEGQAYSFPTCYLI